MKGIHLMNPKRLLESSWRKHPASALGVALAVILTCSETARGQGLDELRSTVQQLEKAIQDVRAKLAELERQNRAATETNVPAAKTASPTAATSNAMTIAEQKIPLPPPPVPLDAHGRSPIRDFDTFNDYQQAAPRPDNKPI